MSILVYFGIALFVLLIQFPITAWSMKRLQCERSLSSSTAFAGESGEMIETMRNYSPFIIPWVRLESHISPHLLLGKQESLQVLHDTYYASMFAMLPYQQIRRVHKIRYLRRGEYDLGGASISCSDLLGVARYSVLEEESPKILVYPALLGDDRVPALLSQQLGEISRRRQLMEDPFLIRGLRAYQPGDPVRDIHWPATARVGQVQVRVHDYSAKTKLLVVLNIQGRDMQWQDKLPEKQEESMEYAISLAATICVRALNNGLSAGFATNTSADDTRDTIVQMPTEGAGTEEALLSTMARLKTDRHQHFPVFLKQLPVDDEVDVLILSHYDNDEIRQARQELENKGCQVTFHLLEGGQV